MQNVYKLLQDLRVTDDIYLLLCPVVLFGAICTLMVVYMCTLCTVQILCVNVYMILFTGSIIMYIRFNVYIIVCVSCKTYFNTLYTALAWCFANEKNHAENKYKTI